MTPATPPDLSTPTGVSAALRAGIPLPEMAFDHFLPQALRDVSQRFWTPLVVAANAAMWFDELDVGDVLDIGAGPGKFCVATALTDQSRRRYYGLEQRPYVVQAARDLARDFGVDDRVSFIEGTLDDVSALPKVAAYYLFNPFGENVAPLDEHLDATVELTDQRFMRDIAATEALLAAAPAGSYVLVYNGFGGRVPPSYEPIRIDYDLPNVLRLWVKVGGTRSNRWPL